MSWLQIISKNILVIIRVHMDANEVRIHLLTVAKNDPRHGTPSDMEALGKMFLMSYMVRTILYFIHLVQIYFFFLEKIILFHSTVEKISFDANLNGTSLCFSVNDVYSATLHKALLFIFGMFSHKKVFRSIF